MSDALHELLARFVAGEPLLPEEEQQLLEAIRRDPTFAGTIADHAETDGLLRALRVEKRGDEAFVRSILDCLEAERDVEIFVGDVQAKIQERPRGTRRGTRRATERRGLPAPERPSPFGWALVATAAVVLLGLLTFLRNGVPPPEHPREIARPPNAPAPEAPRGPERPAVPAPRETPDPSPPPPAPPLPETPALTPGPQEPKPKPPAPAPPRPPDQVAPPPRDAVASAAIESVEGEVFVSESSGRAAAKAGDRLSPGAVFETVGAKSSAVLRFDDRTKIELGADTLLRGVSEAEAKSPRGKRVEILHGTLTAEVAKQLPGQLMLFTTPHGEAQVVGTILRIQVNGTTRVDVKEGRVRLRRPKENRTADVAAGQSGVLATGREIVVRPAAAERKMLLQFDFEGAGAKKEWDLGTIDRAFTFGGSKGSLKAVLQPSEFFTVHATMATGGPALPFPLTDRTRMSFAYYLSDSPGEMKVQFRSYKSKPEQKETIGWIFQDVKVREWTVVNVRVADVFRSKAGTGDLIRIPVTEIDDLQFHAGLNGKVVDLYLDSIEIFE